METDKLKSLIESCHLNFLIGSGASRDHLGTLGNIEDLLTELADKSLDSDKRSVVDSTIKYQYFKIAIEGNLSIDTGDSEELIKTKSAYSDFIENLIVILKERKTNLRSKQVNLFTTNMDLFLEHTLEEKNAVYNDGFSGRLNTKYGTENFHNSIVKTSTHYDIRSEVPLFNLFKLHGSLNWKEKGEGVGYDYQLEALNKLSGLTYPEEEFISIFDGDNPKELDQIIEDVQGIGKTENHTTFLEWYNKFVMINPTKDKFATTTQNLLFYELLRMYSNHLERENSILFVFGFSFADEHIREITKRVAISNPTLLIVVFAYNADAKEAIEKLIGKANNIVVLAPKEGQESFSLEVINSTFFSEIRKEVSTRTTKSASNHE